MSSVLPGQPQSKLQALTYGTWKDTHVNVYITGSAIAILGSTNTIFQTIYDDSEAELHAVTIDEASGKIAAATKTTVRIYRPSNTPEDPFKWSLESSFPIPHAASVPCCLSWGRDEELLIATDYLSLYSTKSATHCNWSQKLPNTAKRAVLSFDSAYIVSHSQHDQLVKVWRRLSYGEDEVRFDFTYLRHPGLVTKAQWRKPFHPDQTVGNVLYTVCVDGIIRIWTPTDTATGQHWQLWSSVNINSASPDKPKLRGSWHICIIDGKDFTRAVEQAVQDRATNNLSPDDVALDHLIAIANKTPEICLAINTSGVLAAWALDVLGDDSTNSAKVFEIAQVNSHFFEHLAGFLPYDTPVHTQLGAYFDRATGKLHLLVHSFDGRIGCFQADAANLLSPTSNDSRICLHNIWSGHSAPVEKIVRNFSGRCIVSRTSGGECIVWNHSLAEREGPKHGLNRQCTISVTGSIRRICVLRKGRFVVFLEKQHISLWDCRMSTARILARTPYHLAGEPLCLLALPRPNVSEFRIAHLAMITSVGHGLVWEILLPTYTQDDALGSSGTMTEFCTFQLPLEEDLKYVLPVDPAGAAPIASEFLDIFARDVAISYTDSGKVDFWTARVNLMSRSVDWLSTCSTDTGMHKLALASGSTLKKAALVDSSRSRLTIWDIGGSRLEFEENYDDHQVIQDLDWTSTPDSQSILAVGFQSRLVLLCQMRFDYLNQGPAWIQIREIDLRDLTPHPIGDSTWLGDGYLVTGAGNQLFVHDRGVGTNDVVIEDLRLPTRQHGSWDLFEVVQRFNGPLSIFHPQFLSQCILSGKSTVVRRVLVALHRVLRYLAPGDSVDDYLGLDLATFFASEDVNEGRQMKTASGYLDKPEDEDNNEDFTEQVAEAINEVLKKIRIPQLSGHEQIQLMDMIECVALVERHRRSLDENGARFMLFVRQHALRKGRTSEIHLSWREINWAYHSNSQDILVDFVTRQAHNGLVWHGAREYGLFMWLSDITAVRSHFEMMARNEYTKSDTKNPVDCSLFYLALRKKTVLQGLWRMASGNKEQAATLRLLANNFDDPKWRTVAQKNAYALLGKRRFHYSAAFFLLAGSLEDAVEVCVKQIRDLQLAVAIARVYEGDDGPVLRKLLQEDVLGLASREGDRWLASWAFWMLGRKDMAVRSLITPVYTLLETPGSPDLKSRMFLTDDPALVVLYAQLRHQTLQTLRGASKINPRIEWEFVLHSAKLYDRMGCDLLGLDLVRNWEFQMNQPPGFGGDYNPLKLLRRRSSLVVNDLPATRIRVEDEPAPSGEKAKNPTVFEEPDMGSLLDSFGL